MADKRSYQLGRLNYMARAESDAVLVKQLIPKEGQSPLPQTQEEINRENYPLSSRNGANAYIIPTVEEKVYLNFIGEKLLITDREFRRNIMPTFEYFVDEEIPEIQGFSLIDGQIFRCTSADSRPRPKESYTYYIMMNGQAQRIPNYRTLEVMLEERGLTLLSVKVLEESYCSQIPKSDDGSGGGGGIPDKSSQWNPSYGDLTSLEALAELENNAAAASDIAAGAAASAQEQIDAVVADAAATQAAADAATAQAQAATAQAAASQAQADAALAQAQATQAEADANALAAQQALTEAQVALAQAQQGT